MRNYGRLALPVYIAAIYVRQMLTNHRDIQIRDVTNTISISKYREIAIDVTDKLLTYSNGHNHKNTLTHFWLFLLLVSNPRNRYPKVTILLTTNPVLENV